MGRKDRTFASKIAKGDQDKIGQHCPKCGELFSIVQVVSSEKSANETWKFKEKFVGVCKCNQEKVYA